MRKTFALLIIAVTVAATVPAFAELQNVLVGGSLRIRGNYWTSSAAPDSLTARNPLFQGRLTNSFRGVAGGNPLANLRWAKQPGRLAVVSPVGWNDDNNSLSFVEQRTKLNVRADFTDQVSAFIEFDSYDVWGEDFRSNYLTGTDSRAVTGDDVEVYQSYIETNETFGMPLRLRIGRQEIKLGSGWLVGTNDAGSFFRGLSFDGIRATYATDLFSVDAIWSKLCERSPLEEDGDIDMYALYGSYLGIENITLDAYGIWIRDAIALADTYPGWFGNFVEDVLDVDDYDATNLYTVGLRGAGTFGAFDFEAEAAYQFGDASAAGYTFRGAGLLSPYGDDDAEFGAFGANAVAGYTFDMNFSPRVFIGGAYFGGEDNRDLDFWDWLGAVACPFWSADASVSFNRMFSDWQYGQFVSSMDHDCSNLWLAYAGVTVAPTEQVKVTLSGAHVQSLEEYDTTWPQWWIFGHRVLPLYPLSFITQENDADMCNEVDLTVNYQYTEDLSFEAGYSHLFIENGAEQGSFNLYNGLGFEGGTDGDDADYVYFETKLAF
jgi:hypothetical protein